MQGLLYTQAIHYMRYRRTEANMNTPRNVPNIDAEDEYLYPMEDHPRRTREAMTPEQHRIAAQQAAMLADYPTTIISAEDALFNRLFETK